jgi:L-fuconolactonase
MSSEARPYPHPHVDTAWLARLHEAVLAPEMPIVDAHHHLWDRPSGRYFVDDLLADLDTGHKCPSGDFASHLNRLQAAGCAV